MLAVARAASTTEPALPAEREAISALLARACEAATGGLIVRDARGYVLFANAAAQRLLGVSLRDLRDSRDRRRRLRVVSVDGVPREATILPFQDVLRSQRSATSELVFERVDGLRVTVQTDVASLHDAAGRSIGTVTTLTDVTARSAAEAELEAARRQLQERVAERTTELSRCPRLW